ncbi:MAG: DUF3500 domain-containing protein [Nitrospiraceae bacterium]|nr:DUF3500 domain-containing protein [Nitrospiraceae bacterium]
MLQFGGHHLAINVTYAGTAHVLTPTHTGTQPDTFQRGGKTVRPLGPENDLAFKLVNMLDDKQKRIRVAVPNVMGYDDAKFPKATYHAFWDETKGYAAPMDGRPVSVYYVLTVQFTLK